ncbi:MAG: transposase [Bdellovibrionota bacterium]|jgi:REP element-mobilizing transposase RayT
MTTARKDIIIDGVDAIYHCTSRCVRRAYLCGKDFLTNVSYEHRKDWVRDRLIFLSSIFSIDILNYSIMDNHLHVLIKTNFSKLKTLSDRELAYRWRKLYPKTFKGKDKPATPSEEEVTLLVNDTVMMPKIRERLGSVSWLMKSLSEDIARKANKEDECTGRFWEGRFGCKRVLDIGAVLKCAVYVDLNPIRAGKAKTPEDSEFTSVHDRIESSLATEKLKTIGIKSRLTKREFKVLEEKANKSSWLAPIFSTPDKKGLLPVDFDDYLQILEWTGKQLVEGKRGFIPLDLVPVLERLKLNLENWTESVTTFGKDFHLVIGSESSIRAISAEKNKKKCFHGIAAARKTFFNG